MKGRVNYKSNNSVLEIEEEQTLVIFEHSKNEIKNKNNSPERALNKRILEKEHKNLETNGSEKQLAINVKDKLEIALIQSQIRYCKSEQLIENIEGNPDFIIPKYRIAIVCIDNNELSIGLNEKRINKSRVSKIKIKEYHLFDDIVASYGSREASWKLFKFNRQDIITDIDNCISQIKNYIEKSNIKEKPNFTFVDLFSGIGGFRIPLEVLGGKCLGFSEIDKYAIETYKNNFLEYTNSEEIELGSITGLGKLPFKNIDLIVGGVPCQSWSVAGKMRGFDDPRGKLWNDTLRVVELNKPKAFIFENVKGLIDPRNKANLDLIIESFEKLGYTVKYQLLNSYDFGLPQNRDRIFIVGIRKELKANKLFKFPESKSKKSFLLEILDGFNTKDNFIKKDIFDPKELFGDKIPMSRNRFQKKDEFNDFFIFCDTRNGHTTIHSWDMIPTTVSEKEICMAILKNRRKKIYGDADGNPLSFKELKSIIPSIKESELKSLVEKKILKYISSKGYVFVNSKNSAGINGIYRIYLPHSNIFSTLTATGTKDVIALKSISAKSPKEYKERFIKEIIQSKQYRPISAREAGKLQGFPNWFAIHKNENLAKKQFGNAVSTTVIYNLAESLLSTFVFKN